MTYREAIKAARERYAEAMDAAAWDALAIVEQHGRPLQTVCKDIAGEDWNRLRRRAQALQERAGQNATERARTRKREQERIYRSHAKAALKDPEMAAQVLSDPAVASSVEHTLYEQARRRGRPEAPEQEPVEWRELFTDLFKIKRRVAGVVQKLSAGLRVPTRDRQDFAETINEIRAGLDLVEAGVLSGRSIADEAADFLEKEASA